MLQHLVNGGSIKTFIAVFANHCTKTKIQPFFVFFSSSSKQQEPFDTEPSKLHPNSPIGSPSRIQKLISSQSDPLLAKEIFDYASHQPNFRHSYSSYVSLILKLGRCKHFSLIDDLLLQLKSERRPVTATLFSYLINVYVDAELPDKALRTFYTMIEFNCKPSPKHLNRILQYLVSQRSYLRPGFDLFKDAHKHGVFPDCKSYNIMIRAFCLNDNLSIAYQLFDKMFKRDVMPSVETYRILMQGLCRKSQVNKSMELLDDMFNKGFVPDTLIYTTLLNSLCRKKKLKEAYKLLCRMKMKGCNPDIVHYNTVILGFCREGHAIDACKILQDMASNGCLPNSVSYRILIGGLCDKMMIDEAKTYMNEMLERGFLPHFSVSHGLIKGICNVGKDEEACGMLVELLKHGATPHLDSWVMVIPRVCEIGEEKIEQVLKKVMEVEIKSDTKIVEAGGRLEEYLIGNIRSNARFRSCYSPRN